MEKLTPFFPINNNVKKDDVVSLVIAIVIYVVASAILGVVLGVLAAIPVVNILVGIVGTLVWIYSLAGIILAVLKFIK